MLVNRNGNPIETFRYSTEEKYTGKNWINGKKIYTKTVHIINPSYISQTNDFLYGIYFDELWIDHSASWVRIGNAGSPANKRGRIIPFGSYRSPSGYYEVYTNIDKGDNNEVSLKIETNKDTGWLEIYCTFLYTKND